MAEWHSIAIWHNVRTRRPYADGLSVPMDYEKTLNEVSGTC